MEYEIRVVDAQPGQLAAMRGATSRPELLRTQRRTDIYLARIVNAFDR